MKQNASKVILVDDHILVRDALADIVNEDDDFCVIGKAGNGKELIELLKNGSQPELIILDLNMPVMDGYDTADYIQKNFKDIHIVVLTMFNSEVPLLRLLQKGIPDGAFNPVTGDDKKICQELKKENARYNKTKQPTIDFDQLTTIDTKVFTGYYKELENLRQDDMEGVQKVKTKFEKLRNNLNWFKDWRACNLWTAAFFWNYFIKQDIFTQTLPYISNFWKVKF